MNSNRNQFIKHLTCIAVFACLLSACGVDSGVENTLNPDTDQPPGSTTYTGPAPETNEAQAYKLNVWENLVVGGRCADCHNSLTNNQSPLFADFANVNTAYEAVDGLVNLDDPAISTLVTKVAGGHNCWLPSDSACEDIMTRYIQNLAGGSSGSTTEIVLRAPAIKDPAQSKSFPADSSNFSSTVYPVLRNYCVNCHVEGLQTPYIASADVEVSYAGAQSKIDLETPAGSRLVLRLRNEFHNCWDGNCATSAQEMEDAISAFSDLVPTTDIDPDLVTSKALKLVEDGLVANAGGRFEDNIIALYEFKTGKENTAYDTSGVDPAINLTLEGNVEWVGGWGIKVGPAYTDAETSIAIKNGKAQGATSDSKKLHDNITKSGEYSVEAWVVPSNVSQEDARIISYSGSSEARNFTLGQTLYNYDFLQRSSTTNQNEAFSTADADERLQASLQHIVVTFAPGQGRRIYVNGQFTEDIDADSAGNLSEWDNEFAFVLGNETDSNSLWQGTLRMVAVHDRALTEAQVAQNYGVGVGEKFFLLFSVSHLTNTPESYVVFEVSQFDSFSYLFSTPYFVSLDDTATFSDIPLKGLKLGINGKEAVIGQAFKNIDIELNDADYEAGEGKQIISTLGTIIPLEQGADNDEFFLSFEQIGSSTNVIVEGEVSERPTPADLEPVSHIGLKTFDEINASMSVLTGIDKTDAGVAATFNTIKQQLPTVEAITGFLSAHQMAITQLAIQYCDALVDASQPRGEEPSLRASFFPAFDFDESANTAFDTDGRNLVISPLLANLLGSDLTSQPDDTDVSTELNSLIDTLSACSSDTSCLSGRTEIIVKASCAAVLGSAVTLVQ